MVHERLLVPGLLPSLRNTEEELRRLHIRAKGDMASNLITENSRDLGEFLRSKRAALQPGHFGLPTFGRRRVPGLRREEFASLAGVGLTWYTWLEQGRDIQFSMETLLRVARALKLSSSDTAYLFSLARRPAPEIRESSSGLEATLQAVLDGYITGPAFACNEMFDVVAFNKLAELIYRFGNCQGSHARNLPWRLFTDTYWRQLYVSWLDWASYCVGLVRAKYPIQRGHARFEQLLTNLLTTSADFKRLWNVSRRNGTSSYAPGPVLLNVPKFGILSFTAIRLSILTNPDWLVVFLSPADSRTATALGRTSADKPRRIRTQTRILRVAQTSSCDVCDLKTHHGIRSRGKASSR